MFLNPSLFRKDVKVREFSCKGTLMASSYDSRGFLEINRMPIYYIWLNCSTIVRWRRSEFWWVIPETNSRNCWTILTEAINFFYYNCWGAFELCCKYSFWCWYHSVLIVLSTRIRIRRQHPRTLRDWILLYRFHHFLGNTDKTRVSHFKILARCDAILDQSERTHLCYHQSNYT